MGKQSTDNDNSVQAQRRVIVGRGDDQQRNRRDHADKQHDRLLSSLHLFPAFFSSYPLRR